MSLFADIKHITNEFTLRQHFGVRPCCVCGIVSTLFKYNWFGGVYMLIRTIIIHTHLLPNIECFRSLIWKNTRSVYLTCQRYTILNSIAWEDDDVRNFITIVRLDETSWHLRIPTHTIARESSAYIHTYID